MKTNEFTYKVMDLNTAQLEIPRETYQRELSPDRVRRIVKAFDERIANEPKVSYRGGHYYVFDGQHTIAARKLRNDNQDLKVRCKVYFGMSDKDEALLFAQQTGASAKLSAGAGTQPEEASARAELRLDGIYKSFYIRKNRLDGEGNFLVFGVDVPQQFCYGLLLQMVVERGLLCKSNCHNKSSNIVKIFYILLFQALFRPSWPRR